MSELKSSTVHRNLDAKMKIVGLEVHDLLFVLLMASVMNIVFGQTRAAFYLVFLLPTILAIVLFAAKRNRPDGYLVHLIRYYAKPGFYSAGKLPLKLDRMNTRINP